MKIKLHELPKMASCRFNYENSALRAREYPPLYIRLDNGELEIVPSSPYMPVGWTDQPPFHTKWDGKEDVIAIMFEGRDFNQIWSHYLNSVNAPTPTLHDQTPITELLLESPTK